MHSWEGFQSGCRSRAPLGFEFVFNGIKHGRHGIQFLVDDIIIIIIIMIIIFSFIITIIIIQPAREARGPEGPAHWEQKGCYWQTVPPQWRGGRLFDGSTGFFYKNCCNSGTESQKIDPKVGNERPLRGPQTGH